MHKLILLFLILSFPGIAWSISPVGVMIPSEPVIEMKQPAGQKKSLPNAEREVDILFSLISPAAFLGEDMDMPQMFAVIIQDESGQERKELLGDLQEIKYMNKKAWGANVAVDKPGLYQFIMESRPWWNQSSKSFHQHFVKVQLPVLGKDTGWNKPLGTSLEILPISRPFGLVAPALFSGQIMLNGQPCKDLPVYAGRINSDKKKFATHWHEELETISDNNGRFAFIFNSPGWWYCEANAHADLLKGPDGHNSPVIKSAIFWIYIDFPSASRK